MRKYPKHMPRELQFTLFLDTPKREWADVAYLLAGLIANTREEGTTAMDVIMNELRAIRIAKEKP